ncbi:MAG: hypothetical protein IK151_08555 [Erysipelotrichaceae bacterium]|nr:hypothetical protein [Erysipelotrichaceae bacterium]
MKNNSARKLDDSFLETVSGGVGEENDNINYIVKKECLMFKKASNSGFDNNPVAQAQKDAVLHGVTVANDSWYKLPDDGNYGSFIKLRDDFFQGSGTKYLYIEKRNVRKA